MYKTILFPVDLSDDGSWDDALPKAIRLAEAFEAKLHVVTVIPDFGLSMVGAFFPDGYEKKMLEEARIALHQFTDERVPKQLAGGSIVAHGSVYREIIHAANEVAADLIVMGAHRPDLEDFLLGPNAARVVRHSRCSVLVVRS